LGEPLRAEIDVPDINAEEAASLRAVVATPDAFVAAGLEYNPVMGAMQVTLQRRADGRAFIRLSSERSINDPFIDMILEASWSSGRIVRDYTMLFDPPALRQATVTPTLPQITALSAPVNAARPAVVAPAVAGQDPVRAPAAARPAPVGAPPAVKPIAKLAAAADTQIVVKSGDTASKIAANIKSADVSLDQMLVALLRSSPDAFIDNNIDRIRAGAVVNVPSTEQARSLSPSEATRLLAAQSKDFNAFRRNLASNAPKAAVETADRKAAGSIQAKVDDKKPAAATPDKLTLSKGAMQSKKDDERIAKERADKDATTRAAELARNIDELKKASIAITPAASASTTADKPNSGGASAPAIAVTAPAAVVAAAPAVIGSAPKPESAAAAKPPAVPVVAPVAETGFFDDLLEDPLIPLAGLGLLAAAVGGLVVYRRKQKKNVAQVDSAFLESRLQPDSFFGASGGQRVDTNNEGPASGSSMVYSASQLDAADDVDPVAEADVYMAYGRDLQAEEILKEAVRTNPGRLAIHTKLLEIFAKRRDTKSFEATAAQAYKLTSGNSPEWARVCEMGMGIDPNNPLYQPGGAPSSDSDAAMGASAATSAFGQTVTQSTRAELVQAPASVDLDLDLDFSLDEEAPSGISDVTGSHVSTQTIKMDAQAPEPSDALDFDLSVPAALSATPEPLPEISLAMEGLGVDEANGGNSIDFEPTDTPPPTVEVPPTPSSTPQVEGMLEFDMGSLSLDLDPPAVQELPTAAPDSTSEDPLETKLALADEFVSIGDEDGARALIEEVLAEASGDVRAKAQRALANLS
jgi:pilus assembly protein FimV